MLMLKKTQNAKNMAKVMLRHLYSRYEMNPYKSHENYKTSEIGSAQKEHCYIVLTGGRPEELEVTVKNDSYLCSQKKRL